MVLTILACILLQWKKPSKQNITVQNYLGYNLGQELKSRTVRQELKQRLWKNTVYLIAPPGLLNCVSYVDQAHLPRGKTAHHGLSPPINNRENDHRHGHRSIWGQQLLSCGPLFSGDYILCQIDKKLTCTAAASVYRRTQPLQLLIDPRNWRQMKLAAVFRFSLSLHYGALNESTLSEASHSSQARLQTSNTKPLQASFQTL